VKIVLLCDKHHNQVALANKISERFDLAGIVIEIPVAKKHTFSFSYLTEIILNRTIFVFLRNTWIKMLRYFERKYPTFPKTKTIEVKKINSEEVIAFIKKIEPDLLMVSGTSIIKQEILELVIPRGIVNLHTGLSPYIKGAPNCTNWCISENKFHLIGNTVMWIDKGIDSGDIVTTETTDVNGNESFLDLHIKVMEHAHDLTIKALRKINDDFDHCPRVKQSSIAEGKTYYNKQWKWKNKWRLYRNFKKFKRVCQSGQYQQQKKQIVTVSL